MRTIFIFIMVAILLAGCGKEQPDVISKISPEKVSAETFPVPQIEYNPKHYTCYSTDSLILVDGQLNEKAWTDVKWSDYFVDIEGDLKPEPRFKTRVKMLWDDSFLYFAGEMEEPDVWATLTDRDAIIFYDNDFEIFIDPDGDTHEYYELEINALSTEWDLFLVKPYRDGGPALHSWDIQCLKTAVHVDGTINKSGDIDKGWTIEIAIPWSVLRECAHKDSPPKAMDRWRINFSRVEWQTEVIDGKYIKKKEPITGKNLPEDNWVWSPQGLINMHYPEMWGFVTFANKSSAQVAKQEEVFNDPSASSKWLLRQLYYAQRTYQMQYGTYADSFKSLMIDDNLFAGYSSKPEIYSTLSTFEIIIDNTSIRYHINHEGKTWETNK